MHGVTRLVSRFIQLQSDLIGTQRARAVGVVLPVITRLEPHAADDILARLHFQSVVAPLDREADFSAAVSRDRDNAFIFLQILVAVLRLPAFAVREAPVVITAFTNQTHIQLVCRQFFALTVGIDNVEFGQALFRHSRLVVIAVAAVVINGLVTEQWPDARQGVSGPDGLGGTTGDRTSAGFQQAGLQNQVERRVQLIPLILYGELCSAAGVKLEIHFIQRAL